jgi:hypothetical protein
VPPVQDNAAIVAARRPAKPGARRPPAQRLVAAEGVVARVLHRGRLTRRDTDHIAAPIARSGLSAKEER